MRKLNNKGFAIGTILYGLLIVMVLLMSLLMSTMAFGRSNSKKYVDEVIDKLEMRYDTKGECMVSSDSLQIMGLPVTVTCSLHDLSGKEIDSNKKYNWKQYNRYLPGISLDETTTYTPELSSTDDIYMLNLTAEFEPKDRKYKSATAPLSIQLQEISDNIDLNGNSSSTGIFLAQKSCNDSYNRCDEKWTPIKDKPSNDKTGFLFYKVNENTSIPFYVIDQEKKNSKDIYLTLISAENINQSAWYDVATNTSGPVFAMNKLKNITSSWNNVSSSSFNMGVDEFKNSKFTGCSNNECDKNTYEFKFNSQRARLITVQEAISLGCRFWTADGTTNGLCPFYLYNNLNSSKNYGGTSNDSNVGVGYWTMNSDSSSKDRAIAIFSSGNIGGKYVINGCNNKDDNCQDFGKTWGLRPVIKIKYTKD